MNPLHLFTLAAFTAFIIPAAEPLPAPGKPLPGAHAHNDYEHPRPLLDALSHGFTSVEADIHLVDGQLLVAHDADQVRPERTLEALYLEPLWRVVRQNRGRVYPGGPSLQLLIDIKTSGPETYQALTTVLGQYQAMLTRFEADQIQTNAVTVIISGNRPREQMARERSRLAAYDGRLADLPARLPPSFAPLISDNWRSHFEWRGEGEFPANEREKLRALVREVHAQGKAIRFWAVPDHEASWRVLHEAGVDWINTDRLGELSAFLRARTGPAK